MARTAYPPVTGEPLVHRIVAERGSLLHLYRMLLHNPGVTEGWLRLRTAIGSELHLDDRTRELATCAVAAACGASCEWRHHMPTALAAGVTQAQLDALRSGADDVFDERDRAVLLAVEAVGHDPAAAGPAL